ncbi:type IV secretion protein DotH [Komagataeibacter xylinus]|uniref:Type IV secretion protein DotH n=1 Tax=Komagataeibacter swingsii TaxID=215220 RepID=A0A2V4QXI1_9PROT|nr:DotH/IcmK family type IV secretion protein [Komagataeibacter swingsii]PYD69291.1 type IV secretion protein DotH [Komagataeibacter swingsii]RFP00597.1 type IV secretion protein DotH [Komagataeibacter xylinus]RFP04503.1 type IV secretion protein DotH [Komagataeibacter xylinus]GBQ54134.1 DotH/IcmK protein [Komagataeibacter swingsii DSM 16373]
MTTVRILSLFPLTLSVLPLAALAQQPSQPGPAATTPADDPDTAAEGEAEHEAIPFTPEEILRLGERLKDVRRATEQVGTEFATPNARPAIRVSFAPGQQTSLIFTTKGYPTALSFVDSTGQPWPIAWNTSGNSANPDGSTNCASGKSGASAGNPAVETTGFYTCVPFKGSNTINIEPMSLQPRGGLLVTLQNAPKPVSFLLIAGRGSYDDNLTVRMSEGGPNAREPVDSRPGVPATGEPYMNAMLSGIPPASAVPLAVEGISPDDVHAWRIGNEVYLRTRLHLMTPSSDSMEQGEGGYTLYAFHESPVVLLSDAGRTVSAHIRDAQ